MTKTRLRTLAALTALTVTALAHPGAAAPPTEAILRDTAIVISDTVTLGDLFVNAGAHADRPVSRAPAPGGRAALNSVHVANAARAAGMLWPNREGYTHLVVNRDGTRIDPSIVRTAIAQGITRAQQSASVAATSYRITFDRPPAPLFVAKGHPPAVAVEKLTFDPRTGHFSAHIHAMAPTATPQRVSGQATQTRKVPMPATPVARGEVLREDMLMWVDVDAHLLAPGVALTMDDLTGMAARGALRRGQAVRLADLRLPIAVEKDARVTISFQIPGMALTATGRALEDAPMGGMVRVLNTRSHRTLHARVVAPDRVVIDSDAPAPLTGQTAAQTY